MSGSTCRLSFSSIEASDGESLKALPSWAGSYIERQSTLRTTLSRSATKIGLRTA